MAESEPDLRPRHGQPGAAPVGAGLIDLCVSANDTAVRAALLQIDDDLQAADLAPALTDSMQIVLAEILNNIVEHAYANRRDGTLRVRIWRCGDDLAACVEDTGAPMPGGTLPAPRQRMTDPSRPASWPEGGFGWPLVHALARDLSYRRANNVNALCFRLPTDGYDFPQS